MTILYGKLRSGQEVTAHGVTNIGGKRLGGGSGSLGRSSPVGRRAAYYGGGRSVAKAISRSKRPGAYKPWFGQVELITPFNSAYGEKSHKGNLSWGSTPDVQHYQSQQWINANYGDPNVGSYKGLQVRLGGVKRQLTKGGAAAKARGRPIPAHQIVREWTDPAPEGIVAGQWYNPSDLAMTTAMGSDRNVGTGDAAYYGGIITGLKPEVKAAEKAKREFIENERRQAQEELQAIEDLKQQKADFEKQQQQMAILAQQTEARTQQLVEETARQDRINAAAEALRLKREARRAKVSPAGQQFQVTKPKKRRKVTRRRYTAPTRYGADPQRASTPW